MKIIIILLIISIHATSQVMWQIKTDTVTKWFLQNHDEFTANALDETKWQIGLPWGRFVNEQNIYLAPNNVIVKDEYLNLIATKQTEKIKIANGELDSNDIRKSGKVIKDNMYEVDYRTGLITSRNTYKNGYFEIRCKANAERGIWPAFWLYGGHPNEEIDIYEGKGDKENQTHVDVHCPSGCANYKTNIFGGTKSWGAWVKLNQSLANDWNIISAEWQLGYVKFFINGTPIAYFKGDFKTAMKIILNSSVAKNNGPFNPGPDATTKWPNSFLIDYVRVWSMQDTIEDIKEKWEQFAPATKTINNAKLYDIDLKKKTNFVYNKKELQPELGTITLLPILYNKFSISVVGKKMGDIKLEVFNLSDKKIAGYTLQNTQYYVLDLSAFATGGYLLKMQVANKTLTQNITIINPDKVGE